MQETTIIYDLNGIKKRQSCLTLSPPFSVCTTTVFVTIDTLVVKVLNNIMKPFHVTENSAFNKIGLCYVISCLFTRMCVENMNL